MIKVNNDINAPCIGTHIQESIEKINNNHDYIFAIQLTYRDNHTIYYLNKINKITFERDFLKLEHNNGSCNYYNYEDITEYHVINADDITDLWGNEIWKNSNSTKNTTCQY